MRYGTGMGLLWAFKFMLFPIGLRIPFLQLLFIVLTLGVPVIGYVFVRRFRMHHCNNAIGFGHAFLFTAFMYLFASMLVAVVHYVYFRYIDGGFVFDTYQGLITQLKATASSELMPTVEQFQEAFNLLAGMTPLEMTFNLVWNNLFWGMLLALPTALLVMRKEKKQ